MFDLDSKRQGAILLINIGDEKKGYRVWLPANRGQ